MDHETSVLPLANKMTALWRPDGLKGSNEYSLNLERTKTLHIAIFVLLPLKFQRNERQLTKLGINVASVRIQLYFISFTQSFSFGSNQLKKQIVSKADRDSVLQSQLQGFGIGSRRSCTFGIATRLLWLRLFGLRGALFWNVLNLRNFNTLKSFSDDCGRRRPGQGLLSPL